MNLKHKVLTGNPTGNSRCQALASRALNTSCYFGQSARSIESRCVVTWLPKRSEVPWALRWRHNHPDGVSNHQPHDCLLNRLVRRRSKKTSKLRVTGLCTGSSPVTGEFPAQMASKAEMFPFDDVTVGIWIKLCKPTVKSQQSANSGVHIVWEALQHGWVFGLWKTRTRSTMTSSNGNIFRVTGPLCGEFTGDRWIPLTKASDAELRCFLWSVPE